MSESRRKPARSKAAPVLPTATPLADAEAPRTLSAALNTGTPTADTLPTSSPKAGSDSGSAAEAPAFEAARAALQAATPPLRTMLPSLCGPRPRQVTHKDFGRTSDLGQEAPDQADVGQTVASRLAAAALDQAQRNARLLKELANCRSLPQALSVQGEALRLSLEAATGLQAEMMRLWQRPFTA